MYDIFITYTDKQDKEYFDKVNTQIPVYIHYYNMSSAKDIKEGRRIKNYGAAKKDPFILVKEEDKVIQCFYSENGNAVNQLISWLNANKSKET